MAIQARTINLPLSTDEVLTPSNVVLVDSNSHSFKFALIDDVGNVITDVSNISYAQLELKELGASGGAPLSSAPDLLGGNKIVGGAEINQSLVEADWFAGEDQHFKFAVYPSELTMAEGEYWLVVTLVTTDSPSLIITGTSGKVKLIADGSTYGSIPPDLQTQEYYNKAQSDARYLQPNAQGFVRTDQVGAANGLATLDANSKIPVAQLPSTNVATYVVADIAARDSLTGLTLGETTWVIDASADVTNVTSGNGAQYIWDGSAQAFQYESVAPAIDVAAQAVAAVGGSVNDSGDDSDDLWSAEKIISYFSGLQGEWLEDDWATGTAYTVGQFFQTPANNPDEPLSIFQVLIAHTSTTIEGDINFGYLKKRYDGADYAAIQAAVVEAEGHADQALATLASVVAVETNVSGLASQVTADAAQVAADAVQVGSDAVQAAIVANFASQSADAAAASAALALETTVDNNEATVMAIARPYINNKAPSGGLEFDGVSGYGQTSLLLQDMPRAWSITSVFCPTGLSSDRETIWSFGRAVGGSALYGGISLHWRTSGWTNDGFILEWQEAGVTTFETIGFDTLDIRNYVVTVKIDFDGEFVLYVDGMSVASVVPNNLPSRSGLNGRLRVGAALSFQLDSWGKGIHRSLTSYNFPLPTESSNPYDLPYTIEAAARGDALPVRLKRGEASQLLSFEANATGSYSFDSISFSPNGFNGNTSSVNSRAISTVDLDYLIGGYVELKFTCTDLSITSNTFGFFDTEGLPTVIGASLGQATAVENCAVINDNTIRVSQTGSVTAVFDLAGVSQTDIPNGLRLRCISGSPGSFDFSEFTVKKLGALVSLEEQNMNIPKGHRQVLDASGNGNHATLKGGVYPLKKDKEGSYSFSLEWTGDTATKVLIDTQELIDDETMVVSINLKGSSSHDFDLGDEASNTHYLAGFTVGTSWQSNAVNKGNDGTNRELTITPTTSFTGTLEGEIITRRIKL